MYIGKKIRFFIVGFCIPALLVVAYCLNYWFQESISLHRQQALSQEFQRIQQHLDDDLALLQQLITIYAPVINSTEVHRVWQPMLAEFDLSVFVAHQQSAQIEVISGGDFPSAQQIASQLQQFAWLQQQGAGVLFIDDKPVMLGYRRLSDDDMLLVSRQLTPAYLSSLGKAEFIQSMLVEQMRAPPSAEHLGQFHHIVLPTLGNYPLMLEIHQQPDVFEQMQWRSLLVIALLLAGGILLVAIGYLWLRYRLMSPFARLMHELANIDPSARHSGRLSGHGGDEFAELAQRINELLSRIFHQKEYSRITLESVAEAVLLTDRRANIVYLNPQAERLLGVSRQQALNCSPGSLLADANSIDAELLQFMAAGSRTAEHCKVTVMLDRPRIIDRALGNMCDQHGQVVGAVVVLRDITAEEQLKEQLRRKANHDATTTLLNRNAFEEQLLGFVRHAKSLAVCYLDLEQFKLINDNCGHEAGDQMLMLVAKAVSALLGPQELLARLGGDEFGLVVRDRSAQEVVRLLKQIVQQVHQQVIEHQGIHYRVGISIGVAFYRGTHPQPEELLKDADIACIAAKRKGSNQIHIFDGRNQELAYERNAPQWALRITKAIETQELLLYFQPIRLLHGKCKRQRLEILLRIKGENGRVLPPAQFIAAAERFKLMPDVDREVIRMSFAWLAAHPHYIADISLSINLSANSLGAEGMLDFIQEQQEIHNIPASSICFEITETSAIQNRQRAMEMLESLRKQGFALALDDFGSGFASYGYLRELPVDYVKIDGCFVRQLATNPRDYAIVKSINDVCLTMGIETVAEFVESQEIIDKLAEIGVNYIQGYAIGRPLPLADYQHPQAGLRLVRPNGGNGSDASTDSSAAGQQTDAQAVHH